MPRSGRISGADKALIHEIRAKGRPDVSPRRLERWRQAGAIPGTERHGLGRDVGGSTSVYPEGTSDQVIALAELMDENRNLDKSILILFANSWPVSEKGLKSAYEWLFDLVDDDLRRLAGEVDATLADASKITPAVADAVGVAIRRRLPRTRVGRVMARNVKRAEGRTESVDSVLTSALSNVVSMGALGKPLSVEGVEEAIQASGYAPDRPREALGDVMFATARLTFPAQRAAVAHATLRELEMARDIARAVVEESLVRIPPRGAINPSNHGVEAGMRMFALGQGVIQELSVPMHAAALLLFIPLIGQTIEQAHEELQELRPIR